MMVPVITDKVLFGNMADIIALIYILALGRFFMALAGLDAGTAFGGEGSSREMTVAILVEPAMMLSLFTAAISAGSTNLSNIVNSSASLYTRKFKRLPLHTIPHPCPLRLYSCNNRRNRQDSRR